VEINTLRIVVMTAGLVMFIGIVVWAWSSRRKASFEQAAVLPLIGD
jgi:cytochrome c oxidase cbb3-type subunit IV